MKQAQKILALLNDAQKRRHVSPNEKSPTNKKI